MVVVVVVVVAAVVVFYYCKNKNTLQQLSCEIEDFVETHLFAGSCVYIYSGRAYYGLCVM